MADPLARLATIRRGLSPAEWARMGAMTATVVGLNVAGWGMLAAALGGHYHISKTGLFGLGTGVMAYTLGMRHAFDADHIAAIDNTTRKLMADGKRPLSVGFFFSLGHSTIVVTLTLLLALRPARGRRGAVRRLVRAAHLRRADRHAGLRRLPLPARPDQPGDPGRHPQGVPQHAAGSLRRGGAGGAAQQPGLDEPGPRPRRCGRSPAVADVPGRAAVRARLRHRDRGDPAGTGGHGVAAGCPGTPSCACRSCSPPA